MSLKEGDFIIIFERDGSTHIRGKIIKKEVKMEKNTQYLDIILDTGEKIRKTLWIRPTKW